VDDEPRVHDGNGVRHAVLGLLAGRGYVVANADFDANCGHVYSGADSDWDFNAGFHSDFLADDL
jgi:hypothetical protein